MVAELIALVILTITSLIYRIIIILLSCYLTIEYNQCRWLWLLLLIFTAPNYKYSSDKPIENKNNTIIKEVEEKEIEKGEKLWNLDSRKQ